MKLIVLLVAASIANAQNWSGIIDPARAIDWSGAGVQGGIPNVTTKCGATINAYSGTAVTINNALAGSGAYAGCADPSYIELGAGTFTLSTQLVFRSSNRVLRGQGASLTKLILNGSDTGCGQGFADVSMLMCSASTNLACSTQCGASGPNHTASWTAGYSKGTTVITLSSTTGLAVGSTIWLDQANDSSDGGDVYVCEIESASCANQGGNSWARPGRAQTDGQLVTNISGNNITISPGIKEPNFTSAKSPGAWWGDTGTFMKNSGVENLSIDFTGGGGAGVMMVNNVNTWMKGVRMVRWCATCGPGSFVFHVWMINGQHVTIKDNYFYGPNVIGNTQYALAVHVAADNRYENNIFHGNVSAMIPNDPESGSVYSYNYVNDLLYSGPIQLHSVGDMMNLYEGNNSPNFIGDILHGTHHFDTLFRNHLDGYAGSADQVNENAGVALLTRSRFFNVIGNVIGDSHFTAYEANMAQNPNAIFELGSQGTGSGTTVNNDSNVKRTLMRWGNWDSVTSTNDNGTNDSTGTRWVSAEVPSGITSYANAVPASQTLPASMYLSAVPAAWWGTPWGIPAWPPIGPDVSSSNITTATGGHANKIPARLAFENTAVDPAYPSSSPRILLFNAATSYTGSAPVAPSVTTTAASSITQFTASTGGNVTSDGGATVTDRGIACGRSASPRSPTTSYGSGTGSFTAPLTSLIASTTYYCAAYATNSAGTSWGADISFQTSAQVLYLRYGAGPKIYITGATNATPIQITTATPHGFNPGDVVWIWGIDGNWNADGTRIVKAVQDTTHFTITYMNGNDAVGNGTFASMTTCKDAPTGPCTTGGGNLLKAWVGSTVAYPMVGEPCCWGADGPSGPLTTAIKDPDGAGAGVAPNQTAGFPPFDGLSAWANANLTTANAACSSNGVPCGGWSGPNYGLLRGGLFGGVDAAALYWYGNNSKTDFHDIAIDWLKHLEAMGVTAGCVPSAPQAADSCAVGQNMDYTIGYFATHGFLLYELMAAELSSADRTKVNNTILNSNTDGDTCTELFNAGTGTITTATGTTGGLTNTLTGSGTNWSTTVSVGDVISLPVIGSGPRVVTAVNSDTSLYYRASGSSGDTALVFSGQNYAYYIAHPHDGSATYCGLVDLGKHSAYSTVSPIGAYVSSGLPGQNNPDIFNNQMLTKNSQMLGYGLVTANSDMRGARLAENTANYFNDVDFPLYQQWWNGPTQIDSQYGPDRFGEFIFNTVQSLYNATSGAVNYRTDRWLRDRLMFNIYYQLPTSTAAAQRHVGYGTSNLAQDLTTKVLDQYTYASMSPASAERNYTLWWRNNVRGDYTAASINLGGCYGCSFAYVSTTPTDGAGTDYTSTIPTSRAFRDRNAAGAALCPSCGTAVAISRQGFSQSSNDTMLFATAFGIFRSSTHLANAGTDTGYNPAEYFIYKKHYLLAPDQGTGLQDASGYDNTVAGTDHSNYFEVGGTNLLKHVRPDLDPATIATITIPRYADGGATNRNKYMYAMMDAHDAYTSAANLLRMNRHFVDFKGGSQQYVVVYDDVATTGGEMLRTYMHYPNNGQTGEGSTTYDQPTNSVVSLDAAGGSRLNTAWLFPAANGFTYTDNVDGTYTGGGGQTFRVSACIGSGTTAAGCSSSATSAEIVAVHQPSMNQTLTMPTITQPSASGFRVIEIDDASAPKVAAFATGGLTPSAASFTTGFTGTAQYLVAGLAPGTYSVTVAGTVIATGVTVVSSDNSLYFEAGPGAVSISTGSPSAAAATSSIGAVTTQGQVQH